jgi:hypothetical protein
MDNLSSMPWNTSLNGANRTQAGSLCYTKPVASSPRVRGDSFGDGFERLLDRPESQCSIGFQPVFRSHLPRAFSKSLPCSGDVDKDQS